MVSSDDNGNRVYSQHPRHTTVQIGVNRFQIRKSHYLVQNHLVEYGNKVRI